MNLEVESQKFKVNDVKMLFLATKCSTAIALLSWYILEVKKS